MTDERPIVPGAEMEHETVHADGVELHVATAGPADGDPVLLLHGYPDFWFGWRHQIPALVEAGYRVIVPDSRGVNESDAPEGVSLYGIDDLAADALSVIDACADGGPVEVVGHDWGGGVAWWLAIEFPELVDRVATINAPHPDAYQRRILTDPEQALRSLYVLFYQLPVVPELLLEAGDWWLMTKVLTAGAREEAFDDAELYDYRQAWARTGAGSLLAPFRAGFRELPEPPEPHVAPPAAVFWGREDNALSEALVDDTVALCDDATTVRFTGASHWVHREVPETVNDLLVRFLEGENLRADGDDTETATEADAADSEFDFGGAESGGQERDADGLEEGDDGTTEADADLDDESDEASEETDGESGEEPEATPETGSE